MSPQPQIWLKRALIPHWIIQFLCFIILFISACLVFAIADNADYSDYSSIDDARNALRISAGVLMGLVIMSVALNVTEIVQFARRRLTPLAHMVTVCVKSAIWLFYFVVAIAGAARGNGLGAILAIVVFLACAGQLIYGSVIMHRQRRGKLQPRGEEYGLSASSSDPSKYEVHSGGTEPAVQPFMEQQTAYGNQQPAYADQQPAYGRV